MIKANLTPEQESIIKTICGSQIQSFLRVSMDNSLTIDLFKPKIANMIRVFNEVNNDPNRILSIDEVSLALLKHNLLNIDFKEMYWDHISNLWKKIFIAEEFKTQIMN